MEISRRRSMTLDYEAAALSPLASSYPPTYFNCGTGAYNARGMKPMGPSGVAERFSTIQSSSMNSGGTAIVAPKKENFISQIFNALTSGVMERLSKVPNSFMTNMNNTLSVTVVPNEGIISQEFFKTLTQSCEQLVCNSDADRNEINKLSDALSNKRLNSKARISRVIADKSTMERSSEILSTNIRENLTMVDDKMERDCEVRIANEDSKNCRGTQVRSDETISTDDIDRFSIDWTESRAKKSQSSRLEMSGNSGLANITEGCCSTARLSALPTVVNVASDRTNPRDRSPESEVPSKKPNLAGYPHTRPRRKNCTVARVRGKGRGRSQLRRSGVSQSSLRKERIKQNIYSDMHEDLETWENSELNDNDDEYSSLDKRFDDDKIDSIDDRCGNDSLMILQNFTVDDIPKLRRQRGTKFISDFGRVDFEPKTSMRINERGNRSVDEHDCSSRIGDTRPRLVSESSIESEDSYCIVFENDDTSDCDDCDYLSDSDEDLDDDDLGDDDRTTMRVRFNLEPQVLTMVKWNFAYRAARRGPWEQMARDRERFQGRIRGIGRIIEPVLTFQHRNRIWQNRFDVDG